MYHILPFRRNYVWKIGSWLQKIFFQKYVETTNFRPSRKFSKTWKKKLMKKSRADKKMKLNGKKVAKRSDKPTTKEWTAKTEIKKRMRDTEKVGKIIFKERNYGKLFMQHFMVSYGLDKTLRWGMPIDNIVNKRWTWLESLHDIKLDLNQ